MKPLKLFQNQSLPTDGEIFLLGLY